MSTVRGPDTPCEANPVYDLDPCDDINRPR